MIIKHNVVSGFEKARGYEIERDNYKADLLGITPPPADVGKETDIKPVSNRTPYKRSPLTEDEDIQDANRNRDRYNRYNNSRFNNRNPDRYNSRRRTGNDTDRWKSRADNDTNWRSRPDSESSTSYDYKHDY